MADAAPMLDLCECGHPRDRHWMSLGLSGTCSVSVDKRHVSAGGSTLYPCDCKGFVPMVKSSDGHGTTLPGARA